MFYPKKLYKHLPFLLNFDIYPEAKTNFPNKLKRQKNKRRRIKRRKHKKLLKRRSS
jgi:hypothetical protein